jgi:hypothetical protein
MLLFERLYIDAFAGTGDRVAKRQQTATLMEMPDLDEMTKGSARIALEIDPAFARYVYIEKRQRVLDRRDAATGQRSSASASSRR